MRFKWAKLLMNLANALEAACGQIDQRTGLAAAARAEGPAVMEDAGIDRARSAEEAARRVELVQILPNDGATRSGGPPWQRLARGTGRVRAHQPIGELRLPQTANAPTK